LTFPAHIDRVLTQFGIRADTKAALYDLYIAMGDEVLEVFADIAEGVVASKLEPDDTLMIRSRVVERFLRRNHPQWLDGKPTASLWHPREAEGRASGVAIPLGEVENGMLMLGRNAHYGGRTNTISFDIIPKSLDDAIAVGQAIGQQHTLPGSVGQTSGTFESIRNVALLWEVQPNVYKPAGERNRAIAKTYRRHRNWHVETLAAAMEWLRDQECDAFILRGAALAPAHEVNPAKPVSETIIELHDRTVAEAARAVGAVLIEPTDADELILLDSSTMNHALRQHVLQTGARGAVYRIVTKSK